VKDMGFFFVTSCTLFLKGKYVIFNKVHK